MEKEYECVEFQDFLKRSNISYGGVSGCLCLYKMNKCKSKTYLKMIKNWKKDWMPEITHFMCGKVITKREILEIAKELSERNKKFHVLSIKRKT